MNNLNNGATASTLPAYLKSEIDRLEVRLSTLQSDINNAKDVETAALLQDGHNNTAKELEAKRAEHRAAVLANLPAPTPLTPGIEKATPYPADELPPIIRDAIHAIAETAMAPLALAGQCVVGAMVYLALTRADAESVTGGKMPVNIAMLSLADSGDRKSMCHRYAFLPISNQQHELAKARKIEIDAYADGKRGLKGQALRDYEENSALPDDQYTLYSDVTFERVAGDFVSGKPLIFWDTDEGGQMLGGHSLKSDTRVATLGGITKLLDNGYIERMRSRGNAEASGTAYNRRFAIHLMAQQVAVQEALSDPLLRGQGFLPRFLFTAPESMKGDRTMTNEEYENLRSNANKDARLKRYWARVTELLSSDEYIDADSGEVTPPALAMTPEAHRLWLEFYNATEKESGKFGALGEISAFVSRAGDQARKLAVSIAVFEKHDHVDKDCMRSAIALVKHSISEWLRHTNCAVVDRVTQQAADLMEWLQSPKRATDWQVFTARDLQRNSFGDLRKSADKRNVILRLLCETNHLFSTDGKTYTVNPLTANRVTAATAATSQKSQGFQSATGLRHLVTVGDVNAKKGAAVASCRNGVASAKPANTQAVAGVAAVTANAPLPHRDGGRAVL